MKTAWAYEESNGGISVHFGLLPQPVHGHSACVQNRYVAVSWPGPEFGVGEVFEKPLGVGGGNDAVIATVCEKYGYPDARHVDAPWCHEGKVVSDQHEFVIQNKN